MSDDVVVGPWPGSNRYGITPGRSKPRRLIPNRYRVGKWGPVQLMDCRECRQPFAPDAVVPRDRLCGECRKTSEEAAPMLELDVPDPSGEGAS
ncbi:hypothetical protein AB0L97_32805 [Nocardia sp. NPDC051911]|uniref:hypothetical protein n=1 Tax=Nocardia sp. NPDC051911 TaxID=3154648 RepID=UPI003411FCAD